MSGGITERIMLDALSRRHSHKTGNGERWVRAEHVRNGTGFYGYDEEQYTRLGRCFGPIRTADFLAIDGYESKGHAIHGYEVKVSRSDWLTELRDPDKAEAFRPYCTYWWLAVSDPAIVKPGELPDGWGLIALTSTGDLRVRTQAPRRAPRPLPIPILIGFSRAVQKTAARQAVPLTLPCTGDRPDCARTVIPYSTDEPLMKEPR